MTLRYTDLTTRGALKLSPTDYRDEAPVPPSRRRSTLSPSRAVLMLALLCGQPLLCPPVHAGDRSVNELEARVRHWLAVRREIDETTRTWKEKQSLLTDELRMLDEQRNRLTVRLDREKAAASAAREPLRALTAEQQRLETALAGFAGTLDDIEDLLRSWQRRIPDFLAPPLRASFARLPASGQAKAHRHTGKRLQNVLMLVAEIEELGRRIHAGHMVIPDDQGAAREVEVLLLGLAVGYAVSADGSNAAIGLLRTDGWTWEWRRELAPTVLELLACYRKEQPAKLITLPMNVEEGSE